MPDDAYDIIMKIHVRAPFRLIRAAAPHMRLKGEVISPCLFHSDHAAYACTGEAAKENRSILNVSSTSGLHGNVGQANYAAAKAAVIGLTKTTCKEWGPFGVRANTIAFGLVHTRLVEFLVHISPNVKLKWNQIDSRKRKRSNDGD
jgi:3-oxoacyl-[acyl-carrier protein] reductase